MDLVSIIVTTYNRTQWLEQAIASATGQTYTPLEVIVVDDGSDTPDAKKIADQYPQVQYLYHKNQGVSGARNLGIANCKGKWIQFLDDDDWLTPDSVQAKISGFVSNADVGAVYSDLYLTDESGTIRGRWFKDLPRPLPAGDLYPILVDRNFIPLHSLLWKREVLENVGGFMDQPNLEDWDCLVRASEICNFMPLDVPLGFYRIHELSRSHDPQSTYQSKLILQSHYSDSKRFTLLPTTQQVRLLSRFAFQQWAYGDPQKALHFLDQARRADPSNVLPRLVRSLMIFGRPFARVLVKVRGAAWKFIGR